MSQKDCHLRPLGACRIFIVGFCLGALCSRVTATDPLETVPANVAGVIVLRHVDVSLKHVNQLATKICADAEGVSLDDVETALNLEDGTLDPSKPIVIMFMRPAMIASSRVVAFVPKDPKEFRESAGRGMASRRYDGPDGEGFANFHEGVATVSANRRALRNARMNAGGFLKNLSAEQRRLYEQSEVFIHFPLARWREEKIAPMIMIASTMMKLSFNQATRGQEAESAQFLDLITNSIRDFFDEMQSVTLTLGLDNGVLRLTHHHDFKPDGDMAHYLGQVERTPGNLFAELPNEPFIFAMTANWRNTKGDSLSRKMIEAACSMKPVANEDEARARAELLKAADGYYGQSSGTYVLMGPSPGKSLPMLMYGGYVMDDAPKALEQFRIIQERTSDSLGAIIPGGLSGKPRMVQHNGQPCMDISLYSDKISPAYRRRIENFYGPKAMFEKLAADKHHLVYSICEPPLGIDEVLKVHKSGHSLADNPLVKSTLDKLPVSQAHAVMLVNVAQMFQTLPAMAADAGGNVMTMPRTTQVNGPLVGWALTIDKSTITGQMAIEQEQAVTFCQSLRKMAEEGPPRAARVHEKLPKPPKPAEPEPPDSDDDE
ncbi:MAG TPA: hypothetical protein VMV81_03585 [Phycisphaerae bacterium]|nr:hypothetical protein [Phycisphaerae bacterium]